MCTVCSCQGCWLIPIIRPSGNHGEDVKELYYYLDSTPTHSYMKFLYKYPQAEYPYEQLILENQNRSREVSEFEIMDSDVFDEDRYWDVFVEVSYTSTFCNFYKNGFDIVGILQRSTPKTKKTQMGLRFVSLPTIAVQKQPIFTSSRSSSSAIPGRGQRRCRKTDHFCVNRPKAQSRSTIALCTRRTCTAPLVLRQQLRPKEVLSWLMVPALSLTCSSPKTRRTSRCAPCRNDLWTVH